MHLITTPQIKKLHMLLNQLGFIEMKKDLVLQASGGRAESSKDLTKDEATTLIQHLAKFDPCEGHRKAIWMLAYNAGIAYGHGADNMKMNEAKISAFLREKGVVKKELRVMNLEELKKIHKQFEGIAKNNRRTKDNKKAKDLTDKLLSELSITVKA